MDHQQVELLAAVALAGQPLEVGGRLGDLRIGAPPEPAGDVGVARQREEHQRIGGLGQAQE